LLQPFAPLLLSWRGEGDLATLTGAEEAGRPVSLPPDRVLAGLYVNELLVRLLQRQDPQSGLYDAYENLLAELAAAPGEEPPLRRFEKRLLEDLGYGLSLDREAVSGQPIVAEADYRYVLDQGPVVASRTETGVPITGRGLLALRDGILSDPTVLKEVKRLTRAALAEQLRGRALKTRELYRVKREV
jgi:DNA repair protein RecO (recombination protein O)